MDKKETTMFVLVCHDTEEWSQAKAFTTFKKAQAQMKKDYKAEFRDAIASGYDKEELENTSNLGEDTAVVGWGCLESPYIFAIHEVTLQ